jgi:tetratricopeptide (TPR) repeat protein
MSKKLILTILISGLSVVFLVVAAAFLIPGIRERVLWRVDEIRMRLDYAIHPPEESVFVPVSTQASTIYPTNTSTPTPSSTPSPEGQSTIAVTPSATATALPASVLLEGIRYQDQHGLWNYCAPANLAMQLSYWGWEGDRMDTGQYLKPFEKDKNVMLYEMADYVAENTNLQAIVRSGGDIPLLKNLIANGFPVLVEKGVFIKDVNGKLSWMGHYAVLNGYDDSKSEFISQDSYYKPDYPISYDDLITQWRSFNYIFIVIYPTDRQGEINQILGNLADEQQANRLAYEKANTEINSSSGSELFFAWFNRGTSMVQLQDYAGAAEAYDFAFQLYSQIPESERPWRMMWYQTGPYFAYHFSGRYLDVINLATLTIDAATEPYLEESFYWRALAYIAMGDTQKAIADLNTSLEYHPGFSPSVAVLQQLGITQ